MSHNETHAQSVGLPLLDLYYTLVRDSQLGSHHNICGVPQALSQTSDVDLASQSGLHANSHDDQFHARQPKLPQSHLGRFQYTSPG